MARKIPAEIVARAVDLYTAGMSSEAVGRELGISPGAVTRYVRLAGGTIRPRHTVTRESCSVGGCNRPHEARGYCRTHYGRHIEGKAPATRPPEIEDVEWMAETGECWTNAVARLGVKPATLERQLERVGRRDLVVALRRREVAA